MHVQTFGGRGGGGRGTSYVMVYVKMVKVGFYSGTPMVKPLLNAYSCK